MTQTEDYIGLRLRVWRIANRLTQKQAGGLLDLSCARVSSIECGNAGHPLRPRMIRKIESLLETQQQIADVPRNEHNERILTAAAEFRDAYSAANPVTRPDSREFLLQQRCAEARLDLARYRLELACLKES